MTVSNLTQLRESILPRLISQFQSAFKVDMSQDVAMLMEVTDQLDKILFDDYVKRRSEEVGRIIRKGVLGGTVDWYEAEKPTGELTSFIPYSLVLSDIELTRKLGWANRGSSIHLRRSPFSRSRSCASIGNGETTRRKNARCFGRRVGGSRFGIFRKSRKIRDGRYVTGELASPPPRRSLHHTDHSYEINRLHSKLNLCIKLSRNTSHQPPIKPYNRFTRRSLNPTTDDQRQTLRPSCKRNWKDSRELWSRVGELPLYSFFVSGGPTSRVRRRRVRRLEVRDKGM